MTKREMKFGHISVIEIPLPTSFKHKKELVSVAVK